MSIQNNELPQNPSVESETIRPFRRFCTTIMTIGNLPSSYQEAMSYQEMLLWLCDFIENKVIPAFDNNANAITELQNLYVELKSYVDNYFTHLDVQEEINNKLDEMALNGTFYNLINDELFTNLNNKIVSNSNNITDINNRINNFISENQPNSINMNMLSQDVKQALTGGSTPIVEKNSISNFNIINNTIDLLNLNEMLKSNIYPKENIINLDDYPKYPNYAFIRENKIVIEDTFPNYSYYKIPITPNKIYKFTGSNFAHIQGIAITDSEDNVLDSSFVNSGNVTGITKIFRSDDNYKYMYINVYNVFSSVFNYDFNKLSTIEEVENIINYNKTTQMQPIQTIENYYIEQGHLNDIPRIYNLTNYNVEIYPIYKNMKYNVIATNYDNSAGYCIIDNNQIISYISSTTHIDVATQINETFTAQFDGYILLTKNPNYNSSVNIFDSIDNSNNIIDFSKLKIGFTGDSICYGYYFRNGYAECLKELYNLNYQNVGYSGGQISNFTDSQFVISNSISQLSNDINAICIEGGINDYNYNTPLGQLTENYTDEINQSTFYGGLEKIFRDCFIMHPGKPIFYIISHNPNDDYYTNNTLNLSYKDYVDAIKETCKKYGVYVINICEDTNFITAFNNIKNDYTGISEATHDGLHPNKNGYMKYYVPLIKNYIQSFLL